ncbi:hypothetical protein PS410_00905 [Pediococcus acidilactici]
MRGIIKECIETRVGFEPLAWLAAEGWVSMHVSPMLPWSVRLTEG